MFGVIPVLYLFVVFTTILLQIQGESCGWLKDSQLFNRKEITEPDEYAWIGRVGYGESSNFTTDFYCLAVLIQPHFAVLPAHCVLNQASVEATFILFGDWRANGDIVEADCRLEKSGRVCAVAPEAYDIEELIVHPKYMGRKNPSSIDHDVALAKLVREVIYSDYVGPLCLPPHLEDEDEDSHIAQKLPMVGFKRRTRNQTNVHKDDEFRTKVEVHTIGLKYCGSLQDQLHLTKNHLCGTAAGQMLDFFGSPLMGIEVSDGEPYYFFLVGLPTFGMKTGFKRDTALFVFTRISPYVDWIKKNTGDSGLTPK
ncbi:phenoloxidase-activating factor 1-like [Drosophila gunungcola]|uniref:phenoloxidase-activating factor 1-like n=1 Tax=Drosophila gunungcola TaxID=103775 RepID=UPI0022E393F1|nr:phenoloxidase-activating factor 1-like [Drosophila gunungcola]